MRQIINEGAQCVPITHTSDLWLQPISARTAELNLLCMMQNSGTFSMSWVLPQRLRFQALFTVCERKTPETDAEELFSIIHTTGREVEADFPSVSCSMHQHILSSTSTAIVCAQDTQQVNTCCVGVVSWSSCYLPSNATWAASVWTNWQSEGSWQAARFPSLFMLPHQLTFSPINPPDKANMELQELRKKCSLVFNQWK